MEIVEWMGKIPTRSRCIRSQLQWSRHNMAMWMTSADRAAAFLMALSLVGCSALDSFVPDLSTAYSVTSNLYQTHCHGPHFACFRYLSRRLHIDRSYAAEHLRDSYLSFATRLVEISFYLVCCNVSVAVWHFRWATYWLRLIIDWIDSPYQSYQKRCLCAERGQVQEVPKPPLVRPFQLLETITSQCFFSYFTRLRTKRSFGELQNHPTTDFRLAYTTAFLQTAPALDHNQGKKRETQSNLRLSVDNQP